VQHGHKCQRVLLFQLKVFRRQSGKAIRGLAEGGVGFRRLCAAAGAVKISGDYGYGCDEADGFPGRWASMELSVRTVSNNRVEMGLRIACIGCVSPWEGS